MIPMLTREQVSANPQAQNKPNPDTETRPEPPIAWLDLESTGVLKTHAPQPLILEIAMIVTDFDLVERDRINVVIRQDADDMLRLFDPVAFDMHRRNGLIDQVLDDEIAFAPAVAQERLRIFLERAASDWRVRCRAAGLEPGDERVQFLWGGCSPAALDRPLIHLYMPELYQMFRYRTLDLTSVKTAARTWGGAGFPDKLETSHRALADLEHELELARQLKSFLSHD